jgi:aromatic ring-opening dioxygenase catalytic subunit (LigB family)
LAARRAARTFGFALKAERQPACFAGLGAARPGASDVDATYAWLTRFGQSLRTPPRAVVCVSAEWSAPRVSVTTSDRPASAEPLARPEFVPPGYAPPGSRAIARKVIEDLLYAKLDVAGDDAHAIDPGAWLPMAAMFPAADVPLVQVSLHASADPDAHFAVGRALERLRDDGVLVLGSGGRMHDASARGQPERSRRFQSWVVDLVTRSAPYARARGLCRFRDHPDLIDAPDGGRGLLPLLVVAGAASAARTADNVGELAHGAVHEGIQSSSFVFRR